MNPKVLAVAMFALGPEAVKQFIAGLLDGLVEGNHLHYVQNCLHDTERVGKEIDIAVRDFEEKTQQGIIDGIKEMGVLIQELPDDFSQCKETNKDIQAIEKWADIFNHPAELVAKILLHIVVHMPKILYDIGVLVKDLIVGDDYDAGFRIADILVLNLGPVNSKEAAVADPDSIEYTQW